MTQKPNGGPAFPVYEGYDIHSRGMTLRQYYAGQALVGISQSISDDDLAALASGRWSAAIPARASFQIADAMIAAEGEQS